MPDEHCYFLTLEVQPLKVGDSFTTTPLHCTLMPRFFSTLAPQQLVKALAPLFVSTPPVELVPIEQIAFGPNRVLVTTLRLTSPLKQLHEQIYDLLNDLRVRYTEIDWVHTGYKPHVTYKSEAKLPLNQNFVSQAIHLIEVEHPLSGHQRFVRHTFRLAS